MARIVGTALAASLATATALTVAVTATQAQVAPRPQPPARIRIVVFRFTSDASNQTLAAALGRLLVRALAAQSGFQVMSHPRASRPEENAQYAVIGHVKASPNGRALVAVQLLEIERVAIVTRDSVMVPVPASAEAAERAAEAIAGRFRERLGSRAGGGF